MKPQIHIRPDGHGELRVNGEPFPMLAGELHNSSASSLPYFESILDPLVRCHLNTVLAPVSWELLEPEEGNFDFTLVDGMVNACRARGLKLVPLWFGTMKNAISCYAPEWVKTDTVRFPRAETTPGIPGWTVSPFCREVADCDARAFAALMRRIGELDPGGETVILVQVENESGILNACRDYSPLAEAAFAEPVPATLLAGLDEKRPGLHPKMRAIRARGGWRTQGGWREVFGADADEVFMAWHVASFLERVAAAGHAEHAIPLFANAWLSGGPGFPPGKYPSGGPIPEMFDVWHTAAPTLSFLSPDIYQPNFREHCAAFAVPGNPLFVPEAKNTAVAAAQALYAIGEHRAIGFSPFGIEDIADNHPLVETYAKLGEMLKFLRKHHPRAEMRGFVQEREEERWEVELGGFRFACRTSSPLSKLQVPGSAILVHLEGDEFLCLGRSLIFTFSCPNGLPAELICLDAGECKDGEWHASRRLNGDETAHGTGVLLGGIPCAYVRRSESPDPDHRSACLDLVRFRIFAPDPWVEGSQGRPGMGTARRPT